MEPKDCTHPTLLFQSGAYYVFCDTCKTRWVALDPRNLASEAMGTYDYSLGGSPVWQTDVRRVTPTE